jgi:hypothetical protein
MFMPYLNMFIPFLKVFLLYNEYYFIQNTQLLGKTLKYNKKKISRSVSVVLYSNILKNKMTN